MITEKMALFVAETRTDDIPQKAFSIARSAISDYVGVTFPGSLDPGGKIISEFARRMGGPGPASVIGCGFRTSPLLASLANGVMGHALDFDDGGSFGHASVVLAPTVLALGEALGSSGKDVLAAYIVGFEAVYPLHSVVGSVHYARGWHGSATTGTLAATAAAAWLLKLDVPRVRMALGIAASSAGGLRQNFGTMTKPLHAGNAASNGVKAALLARDGFTADENILEAPYGFARVLGFESEPDWEKASAGLGKTYTIATPGSGGIHFKLYPSCAETSTSIEAALNLRKEHPFNPADVVEVQLGVNGTEGSVLIHHHPHTGLEGKFSLEYTVARALISGTVNIQHFADEAVNEPAVQDLINKTRWVEIYPAPKPGSRKTFGPNSVTVRLRNGQEYSREELSPRGSRSNPLDPAELKSKYRDCAGLVLSAADVEKSQTLLDSLETLPDIRALMDVVVAIKQPEG